MDSKEKRKLTNLKNIEVFRNSIRKLTIDEKLTEDEKEFLLACSILLIQE